MCSVVRSKRESSIIKSLRDTWVHSTLLAIYIFEILLTKFGLCSRIGITEYSLDGMM